MTMLTLCRYVSHVIHGLPVGIERNDDMLNCYDSHRLSMLVLGEQER